MEFSSQDRHYMALALRLGARMLGQTAPNPAVGCVLVKDGVILARGVTQKGGRPHAETQALEVAGAAAKGCTAYVSLEPCAHKGKTGPCAQALIDAGVARVVMPMEDPDPRVSGKGISMLRTAGITVETGLLADEARAVHEGFLKRVELGRPLFTLKLAATLDGRIATSTGESRWITGETARNYVHGLRYHHDAVMVGIGTVLADDPELTCRLPGLEEASPVRIIVDRQLHISPSAQLVKSAAKIPTWILTHEKNDAAITETLKKAGVKLVPVPAREDGMLDLRIAARKLGELGLTRVLVEGGAHLAAALLREDLIDRLKWFTAPALMGGDGRGCVHTLGLEHLSQMMRFRAISSRKLGEDRLESFTRAG